MNRKRKEDARELLIERDIAGLISWANRSGNALSVLFSITFDNKELIRWRAIEAIGKVAKDLAESDLEKVRDFIRRLLWLMNDESGGLGWYAPEVIGEILNNIPVLSNEYGRLLPHFFREEPFERGAHFAVYRAAMVNPKPFVGSIRELVRSLGSQDPAIRGYTVLALGVIKAKPYVSAIEKLYQDEGNMSIYSFESGTLQETSVASLVKKAIRTIHSDNNIERKSSIF